jgi:hypothetical protein
VFGEVHLARWHGSALARLGDKEAIGHLDRSLEGLDPTFTRATATLRADIADVLARRGEHDEARRQANESLNLARRIGSVRLVERAARFSRLAAGS